MIVGLILLSVALVLLHFAWRGHRVDDHPLCRRCQFDLTGLPETSSNCPECGADLTIPHAKSIGHRHRSPVAVLLSLFLLPASAAFLVDVGVNEGGASLVRLKPAWLLTLEVRSNYQRNMALRELLRRIDNGQLAAGSLSLLIDSALAHQADSRTPWDPAWGNFVERAYSRGATTPEQWSRYARQAFAFASVVATPSNATPGGAATGLPGRYLRYDLTYTSRAALGSRLHARLSSALQSDDVTLPATGHPAATAATRSTIRAYPGVTTKFPVLVDLPADLAYPVRDRALSGIVTIDFEIRSDTAAEPIHSARQSFPVQYLIVPGTGATAATAATTRPG